MLPALSRVGCATQWNTRPVAGCCRSPCAPAPGSASSAFSVTPKAVAVAERVETGQDPHDVHADHGLRIEPEQIAGADVGRLDPPVRADEDDPVGGGVEDLREARLARLGGAEQRAFSLCSSAC